MNPFFKFCMATSFLGLTLLSPILFCSLTVTRAPMFEQVDWRRWAPWSR